jgi:thioesterase domain-containing protein
MGTETAELVLHPQKVEAGRISANATLITPGLGNCDVWIQLPEHYQSNLATNADPFVLGTLMRTMAEAELHGLRRVRVRGTVSPSLLDNLEKLQLIWERWSIGPRQATVRYRRVDIEADDVAENGPPSEPSAAVAAFSGGVDSSFTIYRHVTRRAGRGTRDVRAAALIHGMEIPLHEAASFRGAAVRAHRMIEGTGLELVEISTNLRHLSLEWEDDFGLFVGAVLTLMSGRFGTGLIASSSPYEQLLLPCGSTPLTDPLMSSAVFQIVHDGAEYDRIDKARVLGEWDAARRFMRFCWEGRDKSRNCGHCRKCISTLLCFRVAGVELNCFDAPVRDEVVHEVIRSMDLGGTGSFYPQLLLERANQLSLEDEWVTWLRQRFDQELKHPKAAHASSSGRSDIQPDALVPLTTGGIRRPLFFVNTVGGDAADFLALSSRLGLDQPFYVLQPFVSAGAKPLRRTIESMAKRCLLEIRKVQPHGPFLIGGRSFGAVVAYELAVRLESAGERVALFTAIDSVGPLWRTRYLANGTAYDPVMNAALVRAEAEGAAFGDVFSDTAAADSFTRWLREPAPAHGTGEVSRYVHAVYLLRPDLQTAFPLGEHGDGGSAAAGLVHWAWEHGCSEMGMQPSLLSASSADLRRRKPLTADPRLRSRRRRVYERALDWVNFLTRGTLAPLAARRRDEILRIAGESMVRYRAAPLAATVLLIHPDKDADGLPSAPLDHWYGLELGGLEDQVVVGSPQNILCEPFVGSVAQCLEHRIANFSAEQPERSPTH